MEQRSATAPVAPRTAATGDSAADSAAEPRISQAKRFQADALRRRMLAAADVLSIVVTTWTVFLVSGADTDALPLTLVAIPVWIVLAKLYGLYDRDHTALRHLTADEIPALLTWIVTGTAILAVGAALIPADGLATHDAVLFGALLAIVSPLSRAAARALWRRIVPPQRVLLIGSPAECGSIQRKVQLYPDMHIKVVGTLDRSDIRSANEAGALGDLLNGVVRGHEHLDRVVIGGDLEAGEDVEQLIDYCRAEHLKMTLALPPAAFGTTELSRVAERRFVDLHTWDISRSTSVLKRGLDVVGATVGLVVCAPLLVLIALAVRLSSRGPIFFRQVRVGAGERQFRLYKFRTMVSDAEDRLDEVVSLDALEDPMFKLHDDPRVTRVGGFLRRMSLDELPQLINVLKGDMSLVGPRPEEVRVVERYAAEHMFRLEVRPGITGPMQVHGRGLLTFDERLAVEREYVLNMSLGRDLRILLLTVAAVFGRRGAF